MKFYKLLILFIFGIFFQAQGQNYSLDSSYLIPKNPFWDFILSKKDLQVNIFVNNSRHFLPVDNSMFQANAQELIVSDNVILINISQTGFLYEYKGINEGQLIFKRIDKTVNINYNIDCNFFIDKGDIYSLGGYGFWKSNGSLRKFNRLDNEWDIVPIDKEVFNSYSWYSKTQSAVYSPFEREINAGVANQIKGIIRPYVYMLKLNERKWEKLGKLSKQIEKSVTQDLFSGRMYNTANGILVLHNSEEMYYLDFMNNQFSKSTNLTLNQFLSRKMEGNYEFVYKDSIYSYDPINAKLLSIPFLAKDFHVISETLWEQDNEYFLYVIVIVFVVVGVGMAIWLIRRSIKKKLETAQLKMLKSKSMDQAFNEIELSLINLLIQAFEQDTTVEIHQINHVLGIKDKNIGLQKKVRSDVMNSINDKYQLITQSDVLLISSIRKEEDKRFFEYFITDSEYKSILKFIKK
jgi:hypothetical protein